MAMCGIYFLQHLNAVLILAKISSLCQKNKTKKVKRGGLVWGSEDK